MNKRILLVEDMEDVQAFNKRMLEIEGFTVSCAMTLKQARNLLDRQETDAIILDIGMPDGNGLDFLRELRLTSKIPVLMLTGFTTNVDQVRSFRSGCNDYLQKPYTFEILLLRLTSLLKSAEQIPEAITRGALTLKPTLQEAFVNGEDLLLTPNSYRLLQLFVQNENKLMNLDYVYEKVWGQPMAGNSKALVMAVSRLKEKLKGSGYTITSERKNGYCFERGEA